jgi:autotransporter-associated beta strand protein
VTFNNSGAGNTTVDVRAIVQPSTTVVTGSQAYLFESTASDGKLSGATNSLALSGTGSLELDILSDYGGPTTIGSGTTLTVGNGAVSASIGTGLITNNGALVFNQTNNLSLTNIVGTGAGTLTKNGASTLTLAANNTYNWTTIGAGATLQVGTGGATGSLGSGSVTNDGKLVYNKTGTFAVGTIKTGPANGGELDFLGAANVTLNNGNTYINNTVVDGGVVKLSANEVIPSAATVSGSTGWLVLDGSATTAGTLDLGGFNQSVNALSGTGNTVDGLITNSATATGITNILTVLGSAATTYSGTIADNTNGSRIALVVRGANQFDLRNGNIYSGGTIVGDTATLGLHNSGAAGLGGIMMSNNTSLRMTAFGGSGDPSVFPGNTVTLDTGATVTFTSQQIANGFGISVVGDATATAIIGGATNDTVSFSSGGLIEFEYGQLLFGRPQRVPRNAGNRDDPFRLHVALVGQHDGQRRRLRHL